MDEQIIYNLLLNYKKVLVLYGLQKKLTIVPVEL
jgi:hypothetical protein